LFHDVDKKLFQKKNIFISHKETFDLNEVIKIELTESISYEEFQMTAMNTLYRDKCAEEISTENH